jgi:hypothetical protein
MAPPSAASRSETPRRGKHGEISWLAYPLGERLNIVTSSTPQRSVRGLWKPLPTSPAKPAYRARCAGDIDGKV